MGIFDKANDMLGGAAGNIRYGMSPILSFLFSCTN